MGEIKHGRIVRILYEEYKKIFAGVCCRRPVYGSQYVAFHQFQK